MARWPTPSPFLSLAEGPLTTRLSDQHVAGAEADVQMALKHPGVKEVIEHTMQGPRRHYKNVPSSMLLPPGDFIVLPTGGRHIVVDSGEDDDGIWLDLMEVPPGVPDNQMLEAISKRLVRRARHGPRDPGKHWVERLLEDG